MKAGEHLRVRRTVYYHHGISVGRDKVIHFTGEPLRKSEASIRKDDLSSFMCEDKVEIIEYLNCLRPAEVVERAHSCLGESDYSLVANNCEHFATWCKTGNHLSKQVARIVAPIAPFQLYNEVKACAILVQRNHSLRSAMTRKTRRISQEERRKTQLEQAELAERLRRYKLDLSYGLYRLNEESANRQTNAKAGHLEHLRQVRSIRKLLSSLNDQLQSATEHEAISDYLFLIRRINQLLEA